MRPVIGITSYVEPAAWGPWDAVRAVLLPEAYVARVVAAGGLPVVLPPAAALDPAAVLAHLDGLVLAGGADLDPALYAAEPDPRTTGLRPDRDAAESALLQAALEQRLPLLGICRGMQLLTAAAGGTLCQHLPDVVGHEGHRPEPGVYGRHAVRLSPGTLAHAVLGDEVTVASYHHQGVDTVGSLVASGTVPDDGSVEAVEVPGHPFALGVLWHPEVDEDLRLFEGLRAAAQDHRSRQS
ncbi:putative glutamine amidotransferase [Motilibacter rhizosphaerae]|uniref:Putative glutamine amidotransferase n=1 Tax=Motilibacter rhizosphaerae TaxID=598652 RepID=A0A4Q7NS39_9ACTN|nr:gamma-glutamyl-gamma-aminobutyrate hydrolase family protein [Motilibacter rhizosphaerae]RZS89933.1 putative glutamine amidotransferase [Motilibacter rhizosphaerae]